MGEARDPVGSHLSRLLLATAAATYVLVLLGIYTAATGTGLTCAGRWPLCDGAVFGLFPANWPSFVEWFHRLVAMVTGLMILGSAIAAWRARAPRRITAAVTVAVVLLPVQIWAGAQTVLTYEIIILTTHFLIALAIFTCLLAAAIWAIAPRTVARRTLVGALGLGLVLTVPVALLGPRLLVVHTPGVQVGYYGLGLALVSISAWSILAVPRVPSLTSSERTWVPAGAGIAGAAVAVKLIAGRLTYDPAIQLIDLGALAVAILGFGGTVLLLAGSSLRDGTWRSSGAVDTRSSKPDR